MNAWKDAAIELDEIYYHSSRIGRVQVKNQPQLLVLAGTRHKFFPIRRLADGISGGSMDAKLCQAQEVQRYRESLRSSGFIEITEEDAQYGELLIELSKVMRDNFHDEVSRSKKTFWVPKMDISEAILNAFRLFDEFGVPDGFSEARSWFVSHPDTQLPYPAKIIWGLATGKKGGEFNAHQARDGLRKAGFDCADLSGAGNIDSTLVELLEGFSRETTQVRRERNPVARALCIEHYRRIWSGRLQCAACDFDFATFYGSLGEGFMHVHHLDPISEASESRVVSPEIDLIPVCPNCHAMIHRGGKNRSIAEMRDILNRG